MEFMVSILEEEGGKNKVLKVAQYALKLAVAARLAPGGAGGGAHWKGIASALSKARAVSTWGDSIVALHDVGELLQQPSKLARFSGFRQAVDTLSDTMTDISTLERVAIVPTLPPAFDRVSDALWALSTLLALLVAASKARAAVEEWRGKVAAAATALRATSTPTTPVRARGEEAMYGELGGTPAPARPSAVPSPSEAAAESAAQQREEALEAGHRALVAVVGLGKTLCDATQAVPAGLGLDTPAGVDAGAGLLSALLGLWKLSLTM